MTKSDIKYAEYERRFLVTEPPDVSECRYVDIEDRYLDAGRLRLRKVLSQTGETQYKLCKKYKPQSVDVTPIVNIYLDVEEYQLMLALPARPLSKRRYQHSADDSDYTLGKLSAGRSSAEYSARKSQF